MSQPGARTDAELVHAFTSGDRAALGDMYDRFAPGLYDTAAAMLRDRDAASDVVQEVFCVAAAKLDQLRDATRIKPWLYAVARHEIYRRTERRSRTRSLDGFGDEAGMDPMAPPDPHAEGGGAVSAELASLVRDAASGLDPSDQLLLELSARQGLVGAELAAAIGVPVAKAHSMLFRMRERLERAVGAVVVTRGGRKRCEELAAVLVGWDGRFDVLWRKRISRHIDDCETCQATRRGAAVLSMAGFAPAFALPAMLRERTLSKALGAGSGGGGGQPDATAGNRYRFDADGFPTGRRTAAAGRGGGGVAARSLPIAIAGTLVAGLVIVLAMFAIAPPTIDGSISDEAVSPVVLAPESTDATTASSTTTTSSTTSTSTTTSSTTTTSTSSTSSTTVPTAAPPTQATTPVVTSPPPTIAVVTPSPTVFVQPPRPTTTTTVPPTTTTTTTTTTPPPPPSGTPPLIRSFGVSPSTLSSCGDLSPDALASVFDQDNDIVSVSVSWSGRYGGGSNGLSGSGTQYSGQIGPFPSVSGGTYTVTLTVTDATGLQASSSTTVGVAPC